jgi:hypothetical protein
LFFWHLQKIVQSGDEHLWLASVNVFFWCEFSQNEKNEKSGNIFCQNIPVFEKSFFQISKKKIEISSSTFGL